MCASGRDRDVCFAREFTAFVGELRLLVEPCGSVPASYDLTGILAVPAIDGGTLSEEKIRALFGQYFRFDVISQQPFFYRDVQQFLSGLCFALADEYRSGSDDMLDLTPFDPILVFRGNKDRLVDSLLDTCQVLVRHHLFEEDMRATVLRQYSDVSSFFREKWRSQSNDDPVVDDIFNTWLSYPHWQRCCELKNVLQICFSGLLRSPYEIIFWDQGATVLPEVEAVSSFNFVRSWLSRGFSG